MEMILQYSYEKNTLLPLSLSLSLSLALSLSPITFPSTQLNGMSLIPTTSFSFKFQNRDAPNSLHLDDITPDMRSSNSMRKVSKDSSSSTVDGWMVWE